MCSFFAFSCEDLAFKWLCTWRSSCSEYSTSKRPCDTVRILDFDWTGCAGVAKYPDDLNTSVEWHEDVECGGSILPEHNDYQIQQIFEQLHDSSIYSSLP